MDYVYYAIDYSDSLSHHGIKGQKWGLRRFQNPDGSYTNAGKARRNKSAGQVLSEIGLKSSERARLRAFKKKYNSKRKAERYESAEREYAAKVAQSKADYTTAKAKLDKHMNSLSKKLIGTNSYKVNKYNKQMNEANKQYLQDEAQRQQFEAEAKKYRVNEEAYSSKIKSLENSIVKRGNKYADKYGDKALSDLGISVDFGRNKSKRAFKSYDEYSTALNKATTTRDEAYNKFESYMKKNKMFQPDDDGPVYKSEKDFENGIVDKEGTALWKKYESTENKLNNVYDRDWDF